MALSICSSCQRHVKGDEACPFCGGAITAGAARAPASRMSRAAMLFGVAAVSAACSTSAVALYGAPAPDLDRDSGAADGGSDADAATTDASVDASDGGPVAMYGAPAPDASTDASETDGGSVAMYGAPAP